MIGQLEYGCFNNARQWREDFSEKVQDMGIITFSPLDHVFLNYEVEDKNFQDQIKAALQNGDYDFAHEQMKKIRSRDLYLCDISDFLVGVLNPKLPTFGTIDEIITSKRANKPVFLVVEGGYKNLPLWLCSYFKKEWVYNSLEEVIAVLRKIDSGEIVINSKYWRLVNKNYL